VPDRPPAALLDGRVAVVTGGARGIGRAIAELYGDHGARVVVADVDGGAAEAAAAQLAARGTPATALVCDMSAPDCGDRLADAAMASFGRLDVLVNNAGVTRDATLRTMTLAAWREVLDVHLTGSFLATQAAARIMREQRSGAIVNISSISGKVGMVGQANYSSAKAGMVALTKVAAKELAHHGIRVNVIQPGIVRTAMTDALTEEVWQQKLAEVPMGRAAEPGEVASVALFLASDMASYMTGAVLEVTGGRFA
jgi:3-oxoacyl-[acyl-carrier protein] reductase